MAIFARLVCLLFGIGISATFGGAWAATSGDPVGTIFGALLGAIIGMFVGRAMGNMVVGKPPKED